MPLDWSAFTAFVARYQRFVLMTHVRPDADALGSQLALAEGLRAAGKDVRVVIASDLAPRYRFLDPRGTVERFVPPGEGLRDREAVIVVDTGTWNQLGEFAAFLRDFPGGRLVIDHHRTQDDLGGERLVDTSAEAAGRLVHEAIVALGVPLTPSMATNLFAALATDTGWFRHAATSPRTLRLAEELMSAGANPTELYDSIYEQSSLGRLKLIGRCLERLQLYGGGRIAAIEVYLRDFPETGSTPPDTEDLITYPRSVEGVEVALTFVEQANGGTKVSFRARSRVDVSRIAEQFRGGGHRLASGATLSEPLPAARERVLAAVVDALDRLDAPPR